MKTPGTEDFLEKLNWMGKYHESFSDGKQWASLGLEDGALEGHGHGTFSASSKPTSAQAANIEMLGLEKAQKEETKKKASAKTKVQKFQTQAVLFTLEPELKELVNKCGERAQSMIETGEEAHTEVSADAGLSKFFDAALKTLDFRVKALAVAYYPNTTKRTELLDA